MLSSLRSTLQMCQEAWRLSSTHYRSYLYNEVKYSGWESCFLIKLNSDISLSINVREMWKLNFSLCLDKHLNLKVYIGVEVTLHTSLTSGLDERERLASGPVCLTFVIHWLGVWRSAEPVWMPVLQRTVLPNFLSFSPLTIHCAVPTLHSQLFCCLVYSPVLICFIVYSSGTRFLYHS